MFITQGCTVEHLDLIILGSIPAILSPLYVYVQYTVKYKSIRMGLTRLLLFYFFINTELIKVIVHSLLRLKAELY